MIFYNNLEKNLKKFETFADVLEKTSLKFPKKIFISDGKRDISYEEMNILVNQCCNFFYHLNLKRNDVISIYLKNSIEFVIIYLASMRFGTIVNPFPASLSINEVVKRINFIKSKKIFLDKNHIRNKKFYFIKESFFLKKLKNLDKNFILNKKKKYNEISCLYYSSGTTNNPKIIEYSHKSIIATQYLMCKKKFSKPFSNHLCILPMGHTSALRYSVKQCVSSASKLIIAESFWKIKKNFWQIIKKNKINFFQTVPSILFSLIQEKRKIKKDDLKSLRFVGCGSSYLSDKIKKKFQKKFNVKVSNLYGLSEVGATHYDYVDRKENKPNCIGKPFDFVDVKFFKNNMREAKYFEIGEIAIKTPGTFKSYFKNKKLYKKSFYKKYFLTGDYGFRDKKGFHYYIDRKKNIIIKGGVNIEPEEINEILNSSNLVKNTVTFGIPDPFYGEEIVSFIIPKINNINLENLKIKCAKELGIFKMPKIIKKCKSFPTGPSGKILIRKIKENFTA